MLNVKELEKKWFRYKLKSYVPYLITILSLSATLVVVSYVGFNTQNTAKTNTTVTPVKDKTDIKKDIETVEKKPETKKTTIVKTSPKQIATPNNEEKDKTVLTPSLGFIKNISNSTPKYYTQEKKPQIREPEKQELKEPVIEVKKVKTEVVEKKIVSRINIKRQDTQKDIQDVIKRFKKSNNPALSLFIAKKYYELEDFNKAYNYALITNGINNNIEDSWLIFAKSLVKLNKKSKAVETLKKYIGHSDSYRAKILLENIKSGKLQ